MFLTKLSLDASAVANPYELHRLLWLTFPGLPDAGRPFLFRTGVADRDEAIPVLMLSTVRPVPAADARVRIAGEPRPFAPEFRVGERLHFELKANPVKKMAATGNRVPLIREMERRNWLARQLSGGAELEAADIEGREVAYFRKPGARPGKLECVTFRGRLRVTDARGLLDICARGVGPGKSFGCGLLLLRRPG